MNSSNLTGRLTKDPIAEMKQVDGEDRACCKFTIAVRRRSSKNDKPNFINCIVWGAGATNLSTYCKKGDMLGVSGELLCDSYISGEVTKYYAEIICETIDYLTSKGSKEEPKKIKKEKTAQDYNGGHPIDKGDTSDPTAPF